MVNKAILIGHVGADPEIRSTQEGKKLATFSFATTERWKAKNTGEKKESTEWHRVVVFNEGLVTGIIEPYVKKGSKLYVEGIIKTRKWTDQAGNDKYSTEINVKGFAHKVVLLDGATGSGRRDEPPEDTYEGEEY